MDDSSSKRRPSVRQLSKTPSWVILGVLLGGAFVWTLRRPEPPTRTIVVTRAPEPPATERPPLTTVEAVFGEWEQYAVWDGDVTQIAMWNAGARDFTDFFEVRRFRGVTYLRSITKLTNRIIRHGKPVPEECPLRFTETEEQYRDWLEHGRFERPAETPPRVAPPSPTAIDKPTPAVDSTRIVPPPPPTVLPKS